jgi:hypothetical protein
MTTIHGRNRTIFDAEEAIMGMKKAGIALLAGLGAVVAIAGIHGPVTAQEGDLRAGWQPYLGCWVSMDAEEDQGILCLVAAGQDVEMLTIVDGGVAFSEPLVADGGTHDFERDDCQGTESARFSEDRRRLYTASMVNCDGQPPRRSTGIISMPALDEWVDVRAIETNGATTVWSQRYQRTSHSVLNQLGLADPVARPNPFALRGGITYATAAITIDDVIDASRNVDTDAVKGWLASVEQQFEGLSAADLIRMEDAGVATAVIDVVVAVSFPEQFALNEELDRADRNRYMYGWADPFYYPYYGYGRYGRYGYGGYYGRWYPGYYTPVVVSVNRRRDGGGQAVAGGGYRRSGSATSSSGYSGGSSSVGSSGSSGGSKSTRTSTGRKAVRRGGK